MSTGRTPGKSRLPHSGPRRTPTLVPSTPSRPPTLSGPLSPGSNFPKGSDPLSGTSPTHTHSPLYVSRDPARVWTKRKRVKVKTKRTGEDKTQVSPNPTTTPLRIGGRTRGTTPYSSTRIEVCGESQGERWGWVPGGQIPAYALRTDPGRSVPPRSTRLGPTGGDDGMEPRVSEVTHH